MGLLPGWAGRQTLMNTSSPGYMNPIPCGVKVNDAGTPSVPRSRQNPPTYKRSAQMLLNARSPMETTLPMPGLTIRAYNYDTKVPKTGTDTASCHLKSTDLAYPSRIRSGLLPRIEARGYHRSPAISPSHTRKDRIARYAHDAGPAGRRLFGPANLFSERRRTCDRNSPE